LGLIGFDNLIFFLLQVEFNRLVKIDYKKNKCNQKRIFKSKNSSFRLDF
jgi:hypothetical protein